MKRLTCTICSTIVLFMALPASSTQAQTQRPSSTTAYLDRLHAEGKERVIVKFERSPNAALVEKHAGRVIREIKFLHAVIAEIPMTNMQSLQNERGVLAVVPDVVIGIDHEYAVPFDELPAGRQSDSGTQTDPTGPAGGTRAPFDYPGPVTVRWNNLEPGLNSKAAWDGYSLDGTGVKIAFLDTGVNYLMENLNTNYLGGYDFASNPDDGDPMNAPDLYLYQGTWYIKEDHGTEVASIAVGKGVDTIVGVAYNAGYYAVRVLDQNNTGLVSDVIAAIEWASTEPHKADIISMSLAAYEEDYTGNPSWPIVKEQFEIACNTAYNSGVVLVAGSGNRGYNPNSIAYPASFANVISVGGYAEDQTIYNREINGVLGVSNPGCDVIAPGERVYSVDPNNVLWWVSGTSFATPHVSALIALQIQYARQHNIQPNNGYLWEVMTHSAKYLPDISPDDPNYQNPVYQGKGKIWAAELDPPPPTPRDGSIDCMAANWPISFTLGFLDYAYITGDGLPAYLMGTPNPA